MSSVLINVYPEYNLKPWKFKKVPRRFWSQFENQNKYFASLYEDLGISNASDLTISQRRDLLASAMIQKRIFRIIENQFLPINLKKILIPSKIQIYLHKMVSKLFPEYDVLFRFKRNDLYYKISDKDMVLDVYIPKLNIAFDYKGVQHYSFHWRFGSVDKLHIRDQERQEICKKLGITLIIIPYWWDETIESLAATITKYVPKIKFEIKQSLPISEQAPFLNSTISLDPLLLRKSEKLIIG